MGLILPLLGILTLEILWGIGNVSWNGERHTLLDTVPVKGESRIALAPPFLRDIIMLFNSTKQMIIVLIYKIFYS